VQHFCLKEQDSHTGERQEREGKAENSLAEESPHTRWLAASWEYSFDHQSSWGGSPQTSTRFSGTSEAKHALGSSAFWRIWTLSLWYNLTPLCPKSHVQTLWQDEINLVTDDKPKTKAQ